MCPKRVKLECIKDCTRYDENTDDMLAKFLETGKVQTKFSGIGKYYKKHLLSRYKQKNSNWTMLQSLCQKQKALRSKLQM